MEEIVGSAFIISLLAATIRLATPIIFAALGELITERAGILNLGVEGIMIMGAATSFAAEYASAGTTPQPAAFKHSSSFASLPTKITSDG